jgi:hypothetical protein
MIALIDGDILVYRIGYTTDEEWIARARLRESIEGILRATGSEDYEIWLSDSAGNWRHSLFDRYKANRKAAKPVLQEYITNLLLDKWGAEVAEGQEADDALGIRQTACIEQAVQSVICSIDKDLLQIEGKHYNFVREEFSETTREQALYRFYNQVLVGDPVDNIRVAEGLSCKGIGKDKAPMVIEGCDNELCYFKCVRDAFRDGWGADYTDDRLLLTGQLVKIRTRPNEIWQFPLDTQEKLI